MNCHLHNFARCLPLVAGLCLFDIWPLSASAQTQANEPALSAAEGGPRRWEVTEGSAPVLLGAPGDPSTELAPIEAGALLRNLGCNMVEGQVWCKGQTIGGGPTGYLPAERLRPARGPDGVIPVGVGDSMARMRKGQFDTKFSIPCAQIENEPLSPCRAEVARDVGGDAVLVATFSNSFKRQLTFEHGQFIRGNATMSGVGTDTAWELEDGVYRIRVDDQRFEIPADLLFGR